MMLPPQFFCLIHREDGQLELRMIRQTDPFFVILYTVDDLSLLYVSESMNTLNMLKLQEWFPKIWW
jgi:hypothetical protein